MGVNEANKIPHRICSVTSSNTTDCDSCHHQIFDIKMVAKENRVDKPSKIDRFCINLVKDTIGGKECVINGDIKFMQAKDDEKTKYKTSCAEEEKELKHNHKEEGAKAA